MICPCGQLHGGETFRPTAALVSKLIELYGELVEVENPDGVWKVPRRYIAYHGLKAVDLPALAEKYGWKRIDR